MSFNSFEFFFFFVLVYALYLHMEHKSQNRWLLFASYAFYAAWDWRFLSLIIISTLVDYYCAQKIQQHDDPQKRKHFLWLSLAINLSILGFFKYFNFFVDNFIQFFGLFGWQMDVNLWQIILPVGISFYTFQTISYTIDVYRKHTKAADNIFDYALYVSFFPQLVAGPIERGKRLMPQILQPRQMNRKQISEGLLLIYWGLFKKIFIADNLHSFINILGDPVSQGNIFAGEPVGGLLLIMIYVYMFQLYCDFSAYSDIARGTAKLMGFELMVNFRSPFFSPNVQEMWNRWHISLTTWIRDYLYFPLALNKFWGYSLDARAVVVLTFVIMGFWHGAAWHFILWGLYSGTVLVIYTIWVGKTRRHTRKWASWVHKLLYPLSVLLTFQFAAYGILLFRSDSVEQITAWTTAIITDFAITPASTGLFLHLLLYTAPLILIELLSYKKQDLTDLLHYPPLVRYSFFYLSLYLMIIHGGESSQFIYFQF